MAIYVNDLFTDADETFLEDHTPDTGGAWTLSVAEAMLIISNQLDDNDAGGEVEARNATTADQDDVQVTADCAVDSASVAHHTHVMGRMGSADEDGFFGGIEGSTSTVRAVIYKRISGTNTLLADTGADSRALNTVFTYRLEIKNNGADTDLELFEDDVSILTHTETTDARQGTSFRNFGIKKRRNGSMDNYTAEDVAVAAAVYPPFPRRQLTTVRM